ncbi:MAG: FAD-dependent oxidoreductase [Gemmatimonadota bacterium]|nr:FAD-dependent oxidoreductase [Gemmatimonadota bacterium]
MTIRQPSDVLSPHLAERSRALNDRTTTASAEFVLYWMHHAARGHENPALDVAIESAAALDLPILVYQGLAGDHPYNADRHHAFIMEGARDVHRELDARGLRHVFHLGPRSEARSPLRSLASRAALVVAEDFPAPPFPAWTRRLAQETDVPIWAVDAFCIVPMQSVGRAYARAYEFREATRVQFDERVPRPWPDPDVEVAPFTGVVGFEPIDWESADIAELCAACDIDHGIGPVPHTPGGSRAGYARWESFRDAGLGSYARLRNDAAVAPPRGVSRLSPYIHHGHVSPFRLAREASEDGSSGAEKYLDELLVWRELAHNFCYHADEPGSFDALPDWARDTLERHAEDPRERVYSREALARGKTASELWNAAQRSLLRHGELHNNLRMSWGKALLSWTRGPREALSTLIELNHRYALDGSDPNSYGGLLWCLGLFDRPFEPEEPVIGTVRPRSLEQHAARLDLEKYTARVDRPAHSDPPSVAVIGAGIAGLSAARTLHDHGWPVRVFDKARDPGGRTSTRRHGDLRFDHGAQYFTVRDATFQRHVASWVRDGHVRRWSGPLGVSAPDGVVAKDSDTVRCVGTPGMNAVARHLAADLDLALETRVSRLERAAGAWRLVGEAGETLGEAGACLVTTPPAQAADLLEPVVELASDVVDRLRGIRMLPCWAVMAAFEDPLDTPYEGLFVEEAPISWACRDSGKPGRGDVESWVIHGTHAWSTEHLEAEPSEVSRSLLSALFGALRHAERQPAFVRAHRWRYALADEPLGEDCIWDAGLGLGLCGGWCLGSRVEGAWLSGRAAAGRVLGLPDEASRAAIAHQPTLFEDS